ncbi:peptidylprolyl isomerase [Flavivirga spongiicola]|uniref:Peptidylprolyl isomerase n=1 Tax=Flavivirga spongiicola TaxID=421621 RepID=A0ABU7XNY1_9FLAO|nr:peptidylprolyl isomerase [Flavivirga sp. MEBiC05379]MDO5981797.1 peptidylprolyl isomerase [Flavivirga sp. MEBiC05379]
MPLRYLVTFLLITLILNVKAQSAQEGVLFFVDDNPVYTSEFLRVYNKNLDLVQDESQKDVDEYLTLFTNYKLKLKEARALGFHEKPSYKRELASYKKQLTKSFMTDAKVTDAMVEEAYERISYDVKAAHILVKVDANASAKDTLIAYNNILKLRNRTLNEGFEVVRKEVHNGQTVFGESLGYFSGFRMVYKFETAAFNTNVGEISKPFRTRFGYHIVHVLDKRKSRGERTVAHIMVAEKKVGALAEKPEVRIQDIYKKINQGEDFDVLAKQFSDDKSSASKGGVLKPFSSGQLGSQEFEDVAFGLKKVNDVSEPFKTKYGWHIAKLIAKKPIPEFKAIRPELEEKVKRDDRSKLIDEALYASLKTKYNIKKGQPALDYFESILNDDYYKRVWKLPGDFSENKPLVKIGKKQFLYKDFGHYLLKTQRIGVQRTSIRLIVLSRYDDFLNYHLIKYQEDNLETENEEFAHIINEYRDGLLLFDLMEKTIWNAAKTDSIGIQDFYKVHKSKYILPQRIDAIVASSSKQKILKKVAKLLDQGMALDQIKRLVNSKDKVEVMFTSGIMDAEHQALPKSFQFKKGISKIYNHNGAFVIVQVKDVLQKTNQTLEEAKGIVISDYQTFKEENWLKDLGNKYKIKINQEALNKIKNQIKK